MVLEIKKENALSAFKDADKEGKKLLKNLFGDSVFEKQKVTERIKTFADACQEVNISENMKILLDYNGRDIDMIASQAFLKLTVIARALNEGWTPDWDNSNEPKYYPYFDMRSGVGFSHSCYVHWRTLAHCGSRLCFKTKELAEYAGKQFESIYKDCFVL